MGTVLIVRGAISSDTQWHADFCCARDLRSNKLSQAATWYDSVHNSLFCLPDEYLIYPGHDSRGYRVSCISQEKRIKAELRMPQDHKLAAARQAGAARF